MFVIFVPVLHVTIVYAKETGGPPICPIWRLHTLDTPHVFRSVFNLSKQTSFGRDTLCGFLFLHENPLSIG